MNLFIAWSGEVSERAADLLGQWLNQLMPWLRVHVPSRGSYAGMGWFSKEWNALQSAECAILTLTKENINAPWLVFEAGVLFSKLDRSSIFPVVVDLSIADLSGPLAQFQAVRADKKGLSKLAREINTKSLEMHLGGLELDLLIKTIEASWPGFESLATKPKPGSPPQRLRSDREVLYEILELSRTIAQNLESQKPSALETRTGDPSKAKNPPAGPLSYPGRESLAKLSDLARELSDRK